MPQPQIIFGFTGLIASGKGSVSIYLKEKYGAEIFSFSRSLRDTLNRFYLEQTRDNLINLSEILRHKFGENLLAKTMAQDVAKNSNPFIVIEGIRRLADIEYLKQLPNFILVEISADPEIRYKRLTERRENLDDQNKTYEQFLADQQRSTELSILEVIKQADEHLDNNGDETALQKNLDKLIEKYK
jgi:dephospho-CoA kinase